MQYNCKEDLLKSGIYKITNIKNNRIYIGSAKMFKERYRQHFAALKSNKHSNYFLQADYNKCGFDAFIFEIIEVVSGIKEDKILKNTKEKGNHICPQPKQH